MAGLEPLFYKIRSTSFTKLYLESSTGFTKLDLDSSNSFIRRFWNVSWDQAPPCIRHYWLYLCFSSTYHLYKKLHHPLIIIFNLNLHICLILLITIPSFIKILMESEPNSRVIGFVHKCLLAKKHIVMLHTKLRCIEACFVLSFNEAVWRLIWLFFIFWSELSSTRFC